MFSFRPSLVKFTNILTAGFSYKVSHTAFLYLHVLFSARILVQKLLLECWWYWHLMLSNYWRALSSFLIKLFDSNEKLISSLEVIIFFSGNSKAKTGCSHKLPCFFSFAKKEKEKCWVRKFLRKLVLWPMGLFHHFCVQSHLYKLYQVFTIKE
jgi:hypothetical protein